MHINIMEKSKFPFILPFKSLPLFILGLIILMRNPILMLKGNWLNGQLTEMSYSALSELLGLLSVLGLDLPKDPQRMGCESDGTG